ncbi:MAG: tetratricopeptide repeat protein [Myxococcota bacterium]
MLGPFGLAAVIDLLDGLKLGSYGIHLVVTDRAEAVQAELVARCPEGWAAGDLFADQRDRLAAAAYRNDGTLRLLVGSLDAREPSDQAAARALNTDREWLLREGVCAVVLVVGSDPQDADASHLELQARAPDFWSVRSRVHRVAGDDTERRATDVLLDLLTPRFDGERAAAARWLDGRTLLADWTQYRLWRDGAARSAWLSLAERDLARARLGVEQPDAVWVSDMLGDGEGPKVRFEPTGEAIEAKRWPRPPWPSGMLDPMQRALVSALGVALDLDGVARLYRLPEESTASALTEALLSLGLRRESQVDLLLHLDAREGLEAALGRCLRQAGGEAVPVGLIERARRLQGALGPIDALVLISDASEAEFELLRAALPGRSLAATLQGSVRATFCVCGRARHGSFVEWVRNQLSIWGSGAIERRVETETAPLDLRAALAHAKQVVVFVDSSWEELAPSAWHPLEVAAAPAVALTLEEQALPARMPATREHAALGRDEDEAIERLRRVGRELAGEPRVPSPVGAVGWPPSMSNADTALERALESMPGEADEQRAGLFLFYGLALSNQGKQEEGLRVIEEAVESYRQLTRERPDAFLPRLAFSLNSRGIVLSKLGRPREALQAVEAALEFLRPLAQEQPEVFMADLAMSLNNLGANLSALGRRQEALRATEEAVELRRKLAQKQPEAFMADLAKSLNNLGAGLNALGRRQEALQATKESVELRRQLAEERPETFMADLAMSLNNLGVNLNAVGRREEALQAAEEAVEIFRQLVQERPETFMADLAMSLNNLGIRLSELGRRQEALQATEEVVGSYRQLTQERSKAFMSDLANALSNLGIRLNKLGRRPEALQAAEEAVELHRQLVQERPDAFMPDLAMSLSARGTVLRSSGMYAEAMQSFVEGLRAVLPLFTRLPDAFEDLVASLLRSVTITSQAANLPIPEDLQPLIDQQTDEP